MKWQAWLSLIWDVVKEWDVMKEGMFQNLIAYHLPPRLPLNDLSHLSVIVTGATNGMGLHTAKELAMAGAQVTMACRNIKAANALASDWREEAQDRRSLNLKIMELDLASFSSVRKFAAEWEQHGEPLHILINNAGIGCEGPQVFSGDGIELHMHVNHVAPALLTVLLLPSLLRASSSRIVHVSSTAHYYGTTDTQYWNSRVDEETFSNMRAYATSKLAHIMFLKALATQLVENGKDSTSCIALHPGTVCTNLSSALRKKMFFMFDAVQGARTSIFCATSDTIRYNLIKGFAFFSFNLKPRKVSPKAADMNACFDIWKKTMNILGFSPDYVYHVLDTQ